MPPAHLLSRALLSAPVADRASLQRRAFEHHRGSSAHAHPATPILPPRASWLECSCKTMRKDPSGALLAKASTLATSIRFLRTIGHFGENGCPHRVTFTACASMHSSPRSCGQTTSSASSATITASSGSVLCVCLYVICPLAAPLRVACSTPWHIVCNVSVQKLRLFPLFCEARRRHPSN